MSASGLLVVFSAAQLTDASRSFAVVLIQTYNVSQPQAPTRVASLTVEGSLVTARLVRRFAYVAVSSAAHLPPVPQPLATEAGVMPVFRSEGSSGTVSASPLLPITRCANVSYANEVQPRSLVTLLSIALAPTPTVGVGGLVSQQTLATGSSYREAAVFASSNSVYLASYNPSWSCTQGACTAGEWWCDWRAAGCVYRYADGPAWKRLSRPLSKLSCPTYWDDPLNAPPPHPHPR